MTTPFANLEKKLSSSIDRMYAENTRIIRKTKGEIFSSVADGSRTPLDVVGVIDINPMTVVAQDQGQYDGFQPSFAGDKIHVSYKQGLFQSSDAWPRQDDRIIALDRAGTPTYRVTRDAEDDGIGRILCVCVRE